MGKTRHAGEKGAQAHQFGRERPSKTVRYPLHHALSS